MGRADAAAQTHRKHAETSRFTLMQYTDTKEHIHAYTHTLLHVHILSDVFTPTECYTRTHARTHISRAGVLWLRGEQLEWRLQWWWWAVTIWRSTHLPASTASSINLSAPSNWVDQHVSLCHLGFTHIYVQYLWLQHPKRDASLGLLQPHPDSVIVSFPSGQSSAWITGALISSLLITHTICLWADSCTCAADTTDIQETERKYLEKNFQCHFSFKLGGYVSSCPLCLDIQEMKTLGLQQGLEGCLFLQISLKSVTKAFHPPPLIQGR